MPGGETTADAPAVPGPPPLDGLRVLDLTQHVAGPFAAKLLAVGGARVIKLERPRSGDPMRWIGPFAADLPGADRGLAFLDLNVNKLGITLDLATASGRELALELVRRSDVVVESYRPGTLERFGLGYDALRAIAPAVVLTSITSFGQTGPYRDLAASELVLAAMAGAMRGGDGRLAGPASAAPRLSLALAGQAAAVATLGAALAAARHGEGDWIDVSIMEALAGSLDRATALAAYAHAGGELDRLRPPLAAADEPELAELGPLPEVEHPLLGLIAHPGPFAAFARTPAALRRPAPMLGEHNALVYGELGLDAGDIVALASGGVI
jgi:crotonobetainyl-CoA:carnitine CoA-transferase CaiB-like acyl-CoA transferase